jgi:hypothetical protein
MESVLTNLQNEVEVDVRLVRIEDEGDDLAELGQAGRSQELVTNWCRF